MALGREAGFRGAIFSLLERALTQHLEQVGARERRLLLPEQAAPAVAMTQNQLFKILTGVRIAQAALSGKEQCQFLAQQHARQRFVVLAALIALGARKFRQHHFGGAAVVFHLHQGLGVREPLLDTPTFGIAFGLGFLGFACPVKAPVLAQVVDDARPFQRREQMIQAPQPQLPGVFRPRRGFRKELGIVNQAFALEQARQLCQTPGAAVQAAAQQTCLASREIERVTLLGGLRLVKTAHA